MSIERQKEFYTHPDIAPDPEYTPEQLMKWDINVHNSMNRAMFDLHNSMLDLLEIMADVMKKSKWLGWIFEK